MADETRTFEITADDGSTDEVTLPAGLFEVLSEPGEPSATVLTDLAVLSCAQQIHGLVHHGQGETEADLEALDAATMDAFEERFGVTFAEMTGHSH